MTNKPILIETSKVRVDGPNEENLIFKTFQDIPDWFLQQLKDEKDKHLKSPLAGKEMRRVARIPEGVVEHWLRQGFDVNKESAQAIVARLSKEDLGAFITGTP